MDLIYCDHYEVQTGGHLYGIGAARVSADNINSIRTTFYSKLNEIVPFVEETKNGKRLLEIPLLHGSGLLSDQSDDTKLLAVRYLMSAFASHDARFFVVDYHAKSIPPNKNVKKIAQGLNETNLLWCAPRDDDFALIVEQQDARVADAFASIPPKGHAFIDDGFRKSISYDVARHIGTFVGQKADLGLQVADIVGYLWQCKQRQNSKFRIQLAQIYDEFAPMYLLNERIFLNRND